MAPSSVLQQIVIYLTLPHFASIVTCYLLVMLPVLLYATSLITIQSEDFSEV